MHHLPQHLFITIAWTPDTIDQNLAGTDLTGVGHAALVNATFNNPRIMRDLPRLLPDLGLELTVAWGDAVAEIGRASYFRSFAEVYVPYVTNAGLLPADAVAGWWTAQQQSMQNNTFFACCNYYTYLARRI